MFSVRRILYMVEYFVIYLYVLLLLGSWASLYTGGKILIVLIDLNERLLRVETQGKIHLQKTHQHLS